MTINTTVRTAGPFTGNGVATGGSFGFKLFAPTEMTVVQTTDLGVDSTLVYGTGFNVTLNADQNASPGGTINYLIAGVGPSLIPTGYVLNATSAVSNLQTVKLNNNGGFFPVVINDALDRLTILVQQLVRAVNASLQYPLSDGTGISNLLPNKAARAGKMLGFDPTTGAPVVTTKTLATIEAGADAAAAAAAVATAQAGIATAQAVIATTGGNTATTQAGIATAQAVIATAQANISLNAAGFPYTFSTNTASSDPGSGVLKFNNATLSAATALYISETSALAQALAAILATWDDSTSTIHSQFKMVKAADATVFALFNITGTITDNGTWDTITVAYVGGNGAFANNDSVYIQNSRTGDLGGAGAGIVAGGTAGGTANAMTFTPGVAIGAYSTGMVLTGKIATTNTGSTTVNISGVGAVSINKSIGGALVALVQGDLPAGTTKTFVYDGTVWVLQNPPSYAQGADVASAGTINLDTATGDFVNITGTTGITAITLAQGRQCMVKFAGILTFTNGASLILPTGANITTAAGDVAVLRGEASGVVRCVGYLKADGTPLASAGASGAMTMIKTVTSTAVASISFANGTSGVVLDSTYKDYILVIDSAVPVTSAAELWVRTSSNAGSSYDSGAGFYGWASQYMGASDAAFNYAHSNSDTKIQLVPGFSGNGATHSAGFKIFIHNPSNAAKKAMLHWNGMANDTAGGLNHMNGGGGLQTAAKVDGIQVLYSTGNIATITATLYGIK